MKIIFLVFLILSIVRLNQSKNTNTDKPLTENENVSKKITI